MSYRACTPVSAPTLPSLQFVVKEPLLDCEVNCIADNRGCQGGRKGIHHRSSPFHQLCRFCFSPRSVHHPFFLLAFLLPPSPPAPIRPERAPRGVAHARGSARSHPWAHWLPVLLLTVAVASRQRVRLIVSLTRLFQGSTPRGIAVGGTGTFRQVRSGVASDRFQVPVPSATVAAAAVLLSRHRRCRAPSYRERCR